MGTFKPPVAHQLLFYEACSVCCFQTTGNLENFQSPPGRQPKTTFSLSHQTPAGSSGPVPLSHTFIYTHQHDCQRLVSPSLLLLQALPPWLIMLLACHLSCVCRSASRELGTLQGRVTVAPQNRLWVERLTLQAAPAHNGLLPVPAGLLLVLGLEGGET